MNYNNSSNFDLNCKYKMKVKLIQIFFYKYKIRFMNKKYIKIWNNFKYKEFFF